MYTLNGVDILSSYGITPGRVDNGNTAVQGCFDFPSRIGDVSHEWAEEDGLGLEVYSSSDELFYGGRDITFHGLIVGSRSAIYDCLDTFYNSSAFAASTTQAFSTPYGSFNVYPKTATPIHSRGISTIKLIFREPVITLTGGTLPGAASDPYNINGVPMKSFGLYARDYSNTIGISEMKEQLVTKTGSEGYEITKRKPLKVMFSAYLIAESLTVFKANVKNLYYILTLAGDRIFVFNDEIELIGHVLDGFKVTNMIVADFVIAEFNCEITVLYYTVL